MTKEELIDKLIDQVHESGFKCMILVEDKLDCITHVCGGINDMAIQALIVHKSQLDNDRRRKELLN